MSSRTVVDDLIHDQFPDPQQPLATRMSTRLSASRRLVNFARTCRSKIRKKLRSASDDGSILDLQPGMETAYPLRANVASAWPTSRMIGKRAVPISP